MKAFTRTLLAAVFTLSFSGAALATPSTQIWIPSPDVKAGGEIHFDIDNYIRFSPKTTSNANIYNAGVLVGVLPFEKIKLEVGADMVVSGLQSDTQADNHPFYFNAKLGTPEDVFFKGMPSLAVGVYNMGLYDKPQNGLSTRQNIAYGLVGKTLPVVGRFSAGGYHGSGRALGVGKNTGAMASWDRTMEEISDKLWLSVDYMSGNNANGALSFGGSWAFTKNISVLVGTVIFNPFYKTSAADSTGMPPGGKPAFTTQLDINF